MTDAAIATTDTAGKPGLPRLLLINLPYLALYIITIWLVALTDSDPAKAQLYWQYFIPLVGVVSLIDGWHDSTGSKVTYVFKQFLHWGSLMLVVELLFAPSMQHFLNAESSGFVIAYMLGLTAVLSGIYLEWKMAVFGVFLIASAVGIGFLDDNSMLITLILVALAGIVITLLIRKHRTD